MPVVRPCLLAIILLVSSSAVKSQTNKASEQTTANLMRELRLKWLTTPTSQLGRTSTPEYPHVDAMIMDWPIEEATVSLMASSVGDASIYTTGSFGVIGGIEHESVRHLAQNFVKLGEKYYSEATSTTDYSYPQSGRVRFYFICYDEVRMIEVNAASLEDRRSKYSDLFVQAHRVISELRRIVEHQKTGSDHAR